MPKILAMDKMDRMANGGPVVAGDTLGTAAVGDTLGTVVAGAVAGITRS